MDQEDAHVEITHYGVEKGGNMILPAYINVNTGGIPALRSLSVTDKHSLSSYDFHNPLNQFLPMDYSYGSLHKFQFIIILNY